jgi:hypothetical protein
MNQQRNPTIIGLAPPTQLEEEPFPLERQRGQFLPLISSGVFPMPLPPVPKTRRWWPVAILVCVVTALVVWGVM